MANPSLIGTHIKLELYKLAQNGKAFHIEQVVDNILNKVVHQGDNITEDSIFVGDFPFTVADNDHSRRLYIRSVTRNKLRSYRKNNREFVALPLGSGYWDWKHVHNLDIGEVRQVITTYDIQIQRLNLKRNYWDTVLVEMKKLSQTKDNVRAGNVLDWIPKKIDK